MSQQKEMSKRQLRRQQIRRKETRGRLFGIGLVTLGAVFIAFLFIYPMFKPIAQVVTPQAISRPNVKANAAGNLDAPIKIEEYGDFQCPHCQNFYLNTEPQLMETYVTDGKVYFVYHSFGAFIGEESGNAAEAAYCAGDQNKFWEMHDMIFTNQTGENVGSFTDRRLIAFAQAIDGLDVNEFKSCYNDGKYKTLIDEDAKNGLAAGVKATPSFIMSYTVKGAAKSKIIEGAQGYDAFKQAIDAALAEIGT